MNLKQIKEAVESGKKVYWSHKGYEVIKDSLNEFLIICTSNQYCIGLTWADEVTLNGDEADFFID